MGLRLTPRDTEFFDLLAQAGANIVRGAELLSGLVRAPVPDRAALAEELKEVEHAGDEITHTIMRRLNTTFVTPFDREDIYGLASALDDCLDHLEEAGDLTVLYRLDDVPDGAVAQVGVLLQQARCTAEAMGRLLRMEGLPEYWKEINRLENEADGLYRHLLGELFAHATDAIELLKVKEISAVLEAAADAFETVANRVETIAVKES